MFYVALSFVTPTPALTLSLTLTLTITIIWCYLLSNHHTSHFHRECRTHRQWHLGVCLTLSQSYPSFRCLCGCLFCPLAFVLSVVYVVVFASVNVVGIVAVFFFVFDLSLSRCHVLSLSSSLSALSYINAGFSYFCLICLI